MYNLLRTYFASMMQPAPESAPQLMAHSTIQSVMELRDAGLILRACAVLILFSSTRLAGLAGQYVYYHFLSGLTSFLFAQKSVHVTLFVIFGLLCYRMLRRSRKARFALAVLASLVMGAASETMQIFTHRDPSIFDALLNLCSGTFGAVIAMTLEKIARPRAATIAELSTLPKPVEP